ncbi:MFS transporter [Vibrio sp. TH_r3]|uniref:MFS transporter n=1 Tax=Vibrio sp. TH_r3 TaxID=3082084 RepID=UPI0029543011|nr:MFS transporter [Vibrio sp. TH_r3]MDV7105916.1 MFS transporter [Vibrio sp. TH_r3]
MIEYGSAAYKKVSFTMALGSFLIFCNLYFFQPILPQLAKELAISATQVNWIFASTTLTLSLFLVPWALVSESFGRKKVMLIGLFSPPIINLFMLADSSFYSMVIARACMGISLAAFASVAVAYMAEEMSPAALTQAVGGYIAANSLGGITGRIVGGVVTDFFSWQAAAIIISVATFIGGAVVLKNLPQQKYFKPQRGVFFHHNRQLVQHLRNKEVWFAMLIGGFNFALFVNLFSVISFRLSDAPYSLPSSLTSLTFLCYLSGTLSSRYSGRWAQKYHSISGMVLGTVITATGMFIAYLDGIGTMLVGLLLISSGAFFTHALAYGWVSQKAIRAKATATALYLVHYYIGGSLGGFILIYCWQNGAWESVMAGGTLFCVMIFILCYLLKTHELGSIKKENL